MYSVQTQSFSTQYFHPMVACIRGCGISDAHWGPAAFYLLLDAVAFKMCLHHNNVFSVRRVTCFFITGNTKHMLSNKDVKIIPSAWKETFFFKQVSWIVHHRVSIISALQTPPPQYSSSYLGESQKHVRPQKHLDFHVVFMFGSIVIYHRVV